MIKARLLYTQYSVIIPLRRKLTLLIIGLYLVLNYGFMVLLIPVAGSGIPIGEAWLALIFLTIPLPIILLKMSKSVMIMPFVVWWIYGITRALISFYEHGIWALRDSTIVIDSLFLIVGFVVINSEKNIGNFFDKWLPKVLIVATIFALAYPFREILIPISPAVISPSGREVSVFFQYIMMPSNLLLLSGVYLTVKAKSILVPGPIYHILAAMLFAFAILFFQSRTIYLQVFSLIGLYIIYQRAAIVAWTPKLILVFVVGVFLIAVFGQNITGRLGQAISLEFILNHFLTLFGRENEGVEAALDGVNLRVVWWFDLFQRVTESITTTMFGLGYGFPLVDFSVHDGIIIREPHNSFISIVARLGLFGGVLWLWMHFVLVRVWLILYNKFRVLKYRDGQIRLFLMMVFFILIWVFSIGEDSFEKPFNSIPYWFFWGIVLRYKYLFEVGKISYGRYKAAEEPQCPPIHKRYL